MRKIQKALIAGMTFAPLVLGAGAARAAEPVEFLDQFAEWTAREDLPKSYECGRESQPRNYSFAETGPGYFDRESFRLATISCSGEERGTSFGDITVVLAYGEDNILFEKEIFLDSEHVESLRKFLHQKYGKPKFSEYGSVTFSADHEQLEPIDFKLSKEVFHGGSFQIFLRPDFRRAPPGEAARKGRIALKFTNLAAVEKLFELSGIYETRKAAHQYCLAYLDRLPYAKLSRPARELDWYEGDSSAVKADIHFVGKNIAQLIGEGPIPTEYNHIVCSYNVVEKYSRLSFQFN